MEPEKQIDKKENSNIGMDENHLRKYSLFKALRASLSKDWSEAELEKECSIAVAEKTGKDARGFYMPHEVLQDKNFKRNTTGNAGELVGTDRHPGSFVDALREKSVIMRLGAITLEGLVGNADIPRLDTGAAHDWIAEGDSVGLTEIGLSTLLLSPKTISGGVAFTRRLFKQSSPNIEALLRDDLARGAAVAIDKAALMGTGADEPMGIANHPDVPTFVGIPATPAWADVVGMERALLDNKGLTSNSAYVFSSARLGAMKSTPKDTGLDFILIGDNLNGYLGVPTTLIESMCFGNFADVIIGMWGGLDLSLDNGTGAASGGYVLRSFQDIDVGLRHPNSFVNLIGA